MQKKAMKLPVLMNSFCCFSVLLGVAYKSVLKIAQHDWF